MDAMPQDPGALLMRPRRAAEKEAMRTPLSRLAREQSAFTLIEILVVILIIGILAAIAIPSFLSQKSKANDAAGKGKARTLEIAMETYATDHNGSYEGATLKVLEEYEPTLKDKATAVAQEVKSATATGYEVEAEAALSKDKFVIKYNAGELTRTCSPVKAGGGCATGNW
jgi:type IV pilus assembly protein PilA